MATRRRHRLGRCLLLSAALAAVGSVWAPPSLAESWTLVHFVDGRVLEAQQVSVNQERLHVALAEGGVIVLPLAAVARWELLPETQEASASQPATVAPRPDSVAESEPAALATPLFEGVWAEEAGPHAARIAEAANRHRLHPELLTAVARVESAFNARAVSPKGATGLLQLMPATARRFGVDDLMDADQNVDGGARYLSWLLDRFDGRLDLALAGYNAGEHAVDRYDGVPPYRETRNYVRRVMDAAKRYGLPMLPAE